ncbi:2-dehydropantoate 2-reductase [Pedobacter sp. Du54]|uniref:ketopantoate reductase family protein n=1 Tax=Pedobacter anseongensis TaxID=3133439 RepID=UPI0030A8A3CF
MTKNKIYIIGTGAIGMALAVFLKLAGKEVTLIRGSVDNESPKTQKLKVETEKKVYKANITVATLSNFENLDGIVVLANKSYGNEQLAIALQNKIGYSPIVLLQNGLGIEKPFLIEQYKEIYRCVLFLSCQLTAADTVRFKPMITCPIGIEKGDSHALDSIVDALNTEKFIFRSEVNIQEIIWKKAIANVVFNSICPLLNVDNGIFKRDQLALELARRVISECIVVAKKKSITISEKEVEESVLMISSSSDGQLISTLQDLIQNRPTEIETLNFEIVRTAEQLGIGDELQATRLLGELIKIKSSQNLHTFQS